MPLTLQLLAVLLGLAFALGLTLGAALALWRLPYRLARQNGELESLAIRTLQAKQRQLERVRDRRRGRHLRVAGGRQEG
jgi:flagellar biogenesis protein FliO